MRAAMSCQAGSVRRLVFKIQAVHNYGSLHLHASSVPMFNGLNFADWSEQVQFHLSVLNIYLALLSDQFAAITDSNNIKTAIPKTESVKEFLKFVGERSQIADKSLAGIFMGTLTTMKFDDSRTMHEHVVEIKNIVAKLKTLGMDVNKNFLVQFILNSLPTEYGPFQMNYNPMKDKWNVHELHSMLVQEETRLNNEGIYSIDYVNNQGAKKKVKKYGKGKGSLKDNESTSHIQKKGFLTIRNINPNEKFIFMGNKIKVSIEAVGTYLLILDTGRKPSLRHLHIWSCKAEVKVYNPQEKKLDARTINGNFIGYPEKLKGYIFYYPSHITRIVETGNARFIENDETSGSMVPLNVEIKEITTPTIQNSDFDLGIEDDLVSFSQAISCDNSDKWMDAMKEELKSTEQNEVWDLAELPEDCKRFGCKWVFKTKRDSRGNLEHYKARLVAKGFTQKNCIDYKETFSPVSKKDSFRIIMALVAHYVLELHQMDVKTAFLNGKLDEDVYMDQPLGFTVEGKENLVCKLKNSIYGLKQASQQWYLKFNNTIGSFGFKENTVDRCIYLKISGSKFIFLILYVDDILLATNDLGLLHNTKEYLSKNFEMKDIGEAKYVTGMEIFRDRSQGLVGLSHKGYINKVLERFNMDRCSASPIPIQKGDKFSLMQCPKNDLERKQMNDVPYASVVGSLMYA
ncbi:uncharacterized protein LOC131162792 [Malania oleifera]|uniref:uncharacterized protein LOC131162792 n=1 Tax=Malania oleifera TaxID=397392 RepID=UPI0025AEC319|nr:uncharacterized protein LOC131162792 [Malania oleifera]